MGPEHLRRLFSSVRGQEEALENLRDRGLRGRMTAAGALAFGAVPVGVSGSKLLLAAARGANPGCAPALAAALRTDVEVFHFNEDLVRGAIERFYVRPRGGSGGIDLPTFDSPDFLRAPAAVRRLLHEKSGALPEAEIGVPRGRIAFLDLRLHSVLRSLDRKRRVEFAATPSALPFRLLAGRGRRATAAAVLFRERMPASGVKAIVAQSVFYDGAEHLHALAGHDLTRLPHVLHPSEMQLAEIDADTARFWIYDRVEAVKAAPPARGALAGWSCRYYFLHYGARFERALRLDCLSFVLVRRSRVRLAGGSDRVTPDDLERLFGLDFPGSGVLAGKTL